MRKTDTREIERIVREFRESFDRSFIAPRERPAPAVRRLLALRDGGDTCAVELGDLRGLQRCERLARLPGARPDVAGLISLRGQLVPIFRLSALLERGLRPLDRCWTLLAGEPLVGFAFEALEAYFTVSETEVHPVEMEGHARFVKAFVRQGGSTHSLIDVPALIDAITARAAAASREEP